MENNYNSQKLAIAASHFAQNLGGTDLKHYRSPIAGGGDVYLLDRGSVVTAEDEAMLQALHSRSTGGFLAHLKKLEKADVGKFMEQFYVGYGHGSIGDCGDLTLFIEDVSMLTAKAIQDWQLYNGQEASTRYLDFSKQRFIDPTNTREGRDILESQREFYMSVLNPIKQSLYGRYPRQRGESEKLYEKAINARSFDIARGFLPAGSSTNLAWHSSIRQVRERIPFLMSHPLEEVQNVAIAIDNVARTKFPNSFSEPSFLDKNGKLDKEAEEKYWSRVEEAQKYQSLAAKDYYFDESVEDISVNVEANREELEKHKELFEQRPVKSELPKFLWDSARVSAEFNLDFGSFRDVQRHRAVRQRMPLLTEKVGFGEWYLENLPKDELGRATDHLGIIEDKVTNLGVSKEESQYFVPMGYKVANKISGDLDAMTYLVERRDRSDVHPTLQKVAHVIGDEMESVLGIPLHRDSDPSRFDVRRGKQDIEEVK